MGVVYRGRDTNLQRPVAIKVLPESFVHDADRVARFRREAQLLAALNHSNIAHVYGLERDSDSQALVMELVEGEDLAARIARGPLPLDDALRVARQIADALSAAHEQGVVHRDLKPANIRLTRDDGVKVLDFGLAKLAEHGAAVSDQSPTITSPASGAGVLLGTAPYMSPEQVKGKAVDARTDVWAFGCVLFEMLTGRRAFDAESTPELLAAILHNDVDWKLLPAHTPSSIRRLLRRCLEKDAKLRLHHLADARLDIDDAMKGDEPRLSPQRSHALLLPAIVALSGIAIVGAIVYAKFTAAQNDTPPPLTRFVIPIQNAFIASWYPSLALSPDGQTIVAGVDYGIGPGGARRRTIAMRRFQALNFEPVPGADGGVSPGFIDDRDVAFVDYLSKQLRVVSLESRTVTTLCRVESDHVAGYARTRDNRLVFAIRHEAGNFSLKSVPLSGGEATALLSPDPSRDESDLMWPQAVDVNGTESLLFTRALKGGRFDVQLMGLKNGQRRSIIDNAFGAKAAAGHVMYLRVNNSSSASLGGSLLVQRLGADFTPTGEARPLGDLTIAPGFNGFGLDVAFTDNVIAVLPSRNGTLLRTMVPLAAALPGESLISELRDFKQPDLSSDGKRLLFSSDGLHELWIHDLPRDVTSRFQHREGSIETARWSPDGERVAWIESCGPDSCLMESRADAQAQPTRLWKASGTDISHVHLNGWSAQGLYLNIRRRTSPSNEDLWIYSEAERTAKPLIATAAHEYAAAPSRDGRVIAYVSNDSGREEVYVTDRGGRKVQVSKAGGAEPVWARDGKSLFFRKPDGTELFKVDVNSVTFELSSPQLIYRGKFAMGGRDPSYATTPDGGLMLLMDASTQPAAEINVTMNWQSEAAKN